MYAMRHIQLMPIKVTVRIPTSSMSLLYFQTIQLSILIPAHTLGVVARSFSLVLRNPYQSLITSPIMYRCTKQKLMISLMQYNYAYIALCIDPSRLPAPDNLNDPLSQRNGGDRSLSFFILAEPFP
jgi:hypothetical protein